MAKIYAAVPLRTARSISCTWVSLFFLMFFLMAAAAFLPACGGGGGGGGVGSWQATEDIGLLSISFPKDTSLGTFYPSPPDNAPLTQQVVFTFTGNVKEPVTESSIFVTAAVPEGYTGPQVLLDPNKNLIRAAGRFDVYGNVVVFTPQLPLKALNLSMNAQSTELPGLLPDLEYKVYVPVGTAGAIENLKGVEAGVKNPVTFRTTALPQYYFLNFPLEPPEAVGSHPKDGRTGFPVNDLTVLSGEATSEAMSLTFDRPLLPEPGNLLGSDFDGDGLVEPNIYLRFSDPLLWTASEVLAGIFRLDRDDPAAGGGSTFKETRYNGQPLGLRQIVLNHGGRMTGMTGGVLYHVPYDTEAGSVDLELLLDTGMPALRALALAGDGRYYGIDGDGGTLVRIDVTAGTTETVGPVTGADTVKDLAFRYDGVLLLLRVVPGGGGTSLSHLERVDPETGSTQPFLSNLPRAFVSMAFLDRKSLALVDYDEEADSHNLFILDLDTADLVEVGEIGGVPGGGNVDAAALFYEMETAPQLVSNTVTGSLVTFEPRGMLPFGTEVELMVRNRLENIRGWSRSDDDPRALPLDACFIAAFTTEDLGPDTVDDVFLEDFDDNLYEASAVEELGKSSANWNFQDLDGQPPEFARLVAAFGLAGGGELGDFHPLGVFSAIILDTDYQPLPLFDGSTPDVTQPLVVTGGVFNFKNIVIPEGVTVFGRGSNPLVLTATGDVSIEGTVDVSGLMGTLDPAFDSGFIPNAGGMGGPGGGRGGMGQPPVPPNFTSVAQLQTPTTGEDGWGPGNEFQVGGRGGMSGAKYPGPPYKGASSHKGSRGAGGGGGTFLFEGFAGANGRGNRVPPDTEHDQKPVGGKAGDPVFIDGTIENDHIGTSGEIQTPLGGQGGGGGGSRWDSLNPNAAPNTPAGYPPSMWDAKGGGGGGGGGAVVIRALGTITVSKTGKILARGGIGGGGEQLGVSNFGGAAGGGSGGLAILESAEKITLEKDASPDLGAVIDVSGGRFGDAKESVSLAATTPDDFCPEDEPPPGQFCTLSRSDGGQGGFGIIQLMVPDPDTDLDPPPSEIFDACQAEEIKVGATVWWADPNDLSKNGYPFYKRAFITFEDDPGAYPKTFPFGDASQDPFYEPDTFEVPQPPLVDPHATVADLSPDSYAVSKWIDLLGAVFRPSIEDFAAGTTFPAPYFQVFQGTDKTDGHVITDPSGYVVGYNVPGLNDIEVDAPDLGLSDYIPEDNVVWVEFQAADAAAPGLSVPGKIYPDPDQWTADPSTLSGHRFIRFRVHFNVAAAQGQHLSIESTRPQVNFIRLRVKY